MRQLINIVIFISIIYIIYLIYNNLKNTEEQFQNIIEIHFEEKGHEQSLFKIDLENTDIRIDTSIPHLKINNIIALFPIDEDTVYFLDSTHKLFKANFATTHVSVTEVIFVNSSEYPVKVVGNSDFVYVLTSNGNVYKINENEQSQIETQRSIDTQNAIDIALSDNTLYYLDKSGVLFSNSSSPDPLIDTQNDERFLQIIGSKNYIFGLTSKKKIKRISFSGGVQPDIFSHSVNSINIQLISSDSMFGYIDENNKFFFMLNDDKTLTSSNYHDNVKQASFNETGQTNYHHRIILDTNNDMKTSGNDDTNSLTPIKLSNVQLFAGVNMNNTFVLMGDNVPTIENVPIPDHPKKCPECDICTENTFDSCDSIFVAIKGLLDPSSQNCNS